MSLYEKIVSTKQGRQLYEQETLIQEMTELVCLLLEQKKITRTTLARRLGWKKSELDKFLDGQYNVRIKTIADVFTALKVRLKLSATEFD